LSTIGWSRLCDTLGQTETGPICEPALERWCARSARHRACGRVSHRPNGPPDPGRARIARPQSLLQDQGWTPGSTPSPCRRGWLLHARLLLTPHDVGQPAGSESSRKAAKPPASDDKRHHQLWPDRHSSRTGAYRRPPHVFRASSMRPPQPAPDLPDLALCERHPEQPPNVGRICIQINRARSGPRTHVRP
jgi:hypothetical protein